MKMKFLGIPNRVITDSRTKKVLLTFDDKGEFVTENLAIIGRAFGHFDSVEIKEVVTEPIQEPIKNEEEYKCEKCGKVCKNKLGLNTHLKACKGE